MSFFNAEYKLRKLKIKGQLHLNIESTDFMTEDFTHLENVITDKLIDFITKWLSDDDTLEFIDKERLKPKYL